MENRNGLVLDFVVSEATGTVERESGAIAPRRWEETRATTADQGDLRVDEDGGRVPVDLVSRSGAYWIGRVLGGCGLQLSVDGEADVESGDSGSSVGVN